MAINYYNFYFSADHMFFFHKIKVIYDFFQTFRN